MCQSRTPGALRSFAPYRCGLAPKSQSMPPWSAPFFRMDDRPGTETQPGVAVRAACAAARRKRRQTYPELDRGRRCRLVVFGLEVGGRWDAEAASFRRLLARARASVTPAALRPAAQAAWVASSRLLRNERLQPRFWSCHCRRSPVLPDRQRLCTSSSLTPDGKPGHNVAASLPARSCR